MKKIIYLTSIIILLLSTIIFTTKVFSQEGEERVSAFHKSLELAYEGDYSSAISELTKVYNKFGITLEEEVRIIFEDGCFQSCQHYNNREG